MQELSFLIKSVDEKQLREGACTVENLITIQYGLDAGQAG